MPQLTQSKNEVVLHLLNGTFSSLNQVIPLNYEILEKKALTKGVPITFGVLVGFTGNLKGKLIISAEKDVFSHLAQVMFGIPPEGDMLNSFSGELGNMIAGNLSTNIVEHGINIDITAPTMMDGCTTITGYKHAIQISVSFEQNKMLIVYLLID